MIFGVPQNERIPFQRPDQATPVFRPPYPHTGFLAHLTPFATLPPMLSQRAVLPRGPGGMAPAPAMAAMPEPGPVAGYLGHGPGATNPYMVMRSGMVPGIYGDGRNLRYGVRTAGAVPRAMTPYAFTQSNDPAGSTLPVAAPAAAPAAPAINGAFRGFGTAFGRGR